jgi:exopolysaccharide biosynthesis polyprenyl glycosylphosphotransferase
MVISKRKYVLILGDLAICYFSLWVAMSVRVFSVVNTQFYLKHAVTFSAVFFVWILTLYTLGLYEFRAMRNRISLLQSLLRAFAVNTLLGVALFYALYPYYGLTPKSQLLLASFLAHILFFSWRHLWIRLFSSKLMAQRIWFLGENKTLTQIREDLITHPHLGFKPISSDHGLRNARFADLSQWRPSYRPSDGLRTFTDIIIIPHETLEHDPGKFQAIFVAATVDDIPVLTDIDFYETLYGKIPPDHAARPEWLLANILAHQQRIYPVFKRWLDVAISMLGLIALIFPMLVIAAISRMTGIHKPLYGQRRLGYKGREFVIWKFRTMEEGSDQNGPFEKSRAPSTITTWGGILRRIRLDEIPQLWNVFKGDMSLVGPRPEWMEEVEVLEKHVPHYHLRHLVHPGITGWAQVNFKATCGPEDSKEKLRYDLYYVKKISFALDIGILLKTIKRVFISEASFLSPISSSPKSPTEDISTTEHSE